MDGQKWSGQVKYDHDFGADRLWFANLQAGVDHDRFLDIDYRLMPAAGLGRHLVRCDEGVWDADISFGREYTHYRNGTASDDTAVFIGHTFIRFKIFERACFSEDFTAISRFENGVRIISEAVFSNPLRDRIDFEVKYIVEYDSDPAEGKTTTDKRFIAGIKYKF
jgi:putative salt-induced outer membrane protein YdiY